MRRAEAAAGAVTRSGETLGPNVLFVKHLRANRSF